MNAAQLISTFGAGILAGLGATVPIGAIGVLLLKEGNDRGWRRGAPAACGVGLADFLYCVVALAAGTVVAPVVERWGRWPAAVGGVLLLVVAALTLRNAYRGRPPGEEPDGARPALTGLRRFALFFGLTIINPMPLLYFLAIAVGLGSRLHEPAVAGVFALGVGIASLGWCQVLVAVGAALRSRSTEATQRRISLAGGIIVAICGVAVVVTAFL
ncbi:Lysine exporter protein (LYSE/YGGA) OS=Tsukamurella paurometabola (strain ATCC 8368 / DSM /CCUG 35730 / CIP 100753 / JCM 10117 / KCTC 9821 / NBRC 16120/ NCIMB 702349 / NCTC 13040) OX=521096 GN=Tpau_4097 PE=4 SV=1 [Tsukamurella paurometabola]|uniref:Lysine exporter protein (LYSE/YGGA) n=1 Tax=Tsukamurella paurometabola (strain ATCC 8368 / DSM 20162 / CCUG 35730 / CIP 100753 / JCM 10117 / KCTC 9821 / NBRC 16120 / NCIMB 702349 / NCTC 13040) TaxID=521096 RepID=D5UNH1_TSUPD|nr:LysE family transporter [Tsukamurella paurometabola]ADG80666.1 Lysine exporter protein (LYSE/YGGA) [Tsukamurella paurometabola DSM 20162]SUP40495.1 L-lysine exporter [Tsukamurella paurometabola]